jgi:hypothetical protein
MSIRLRSAALLALLALPSTLCATEPSSKPDQADAIAALIDKYLAEDWTARGIKPTAMADDAEFVRRVYLDLIGRIPKAAETRAFLEDHSPDKRKVLVDNLLTMPAHAVYFASVTRAAWLPQTLTNFEFIGSGIQFETWLRAKFTDNTPADEVVRKILTVPLTFNANQRNRFIQPNPNDPEEFMLAGFYQANEVRPENVGSAVSRLFLGMKLECAQCHDHPFARYTREQFWEFAAFFADLNPLPAERPGLVGPKEPQSSINRLTIPKTERQVVARFFDGTEPKWSNEFTPRQELARWLVSPQNEFFAKNLANRMWAHFFGYGIQDPLDEPGENNAPSHPELLELLGKAFAGAKFDNRVLMRGIVRSQAYQLSSKLTHPSQANARRFAKMNLKGLTPHQLFDSMVAATGHREPSFMKQNQFNFNPQPNNPRSQFLNRFASTERATETHTTILQALMLMNGKFVTEVTSLEKGEVLVAIAEMPGWDTKKRVSALFLTAFSREPTEDELEKLASYVDGGGVNNDKKRALADVFWVLLNSSEFLFNH